MLSNKLFTPLFPATATKPASQSRINADTKSKANTLAALKDFLSTPAWLEIGAALFIPVYLVLHPLIGAYVLLLPVTLMAIRSGTSLAMAYGLLPNPYMDGVVPFKAAAQLPDPVTGEFGPEIANQPICVFIIGAKNNHPLSLLAPGFKQLGAYFAALQKHVDERAHDYGLLGQSSWSEVGSRASQNELMNVMYFRSSAGLNKFAHDELHSEAWNWWNKHVKEHAHLAIYHEVFEVPAGSWEGIYANAKPTLMGNLAHPIKTETGTKWQNGLVDARKGPLSSMRGRMPAYASSYI